MSDLIKKSDAIKALDNAWINGTSLLDANEAVKQLNDLPSADRPQGEWIYTNNPLRLDDEWACSRCGNISFLRTNFCDRCGSRMKGADDETD